SGSQYGIEHERSHETPYCRTQGACVVRRALIGEQTRRERILASTTSRLLSISMLATTRVAQRVIESLHGGEPSCSLCPSRGWIGSDAPDLRDETWAAAVARGHGLGVCMCARAPAAACATAPDGPRTEDLERHAGERPPGDRRRGSQGHRSTGHHALPGRLR